MTTATAPARMESIAEAIRTAIDGTTPVLRVHASDNIMSSVHVSGSLDPKETWSNGIYENSRHFRFSITPARGQRYYNGEPKVTVELFQCSYRIPVKFRKSTTTPDKAIARISKWIQEVC